MPSIAATKLISRPARPERQQVDRRGRVRMLTARSQHDRGSSNQSRRRSRCTLGAAGGGGDSRSRMIPFRLQGSSPRSAGEPQVQDSGIDPEPGDAPQDHGRAASPARQQPPPARNPSTIIWPSPRRLDHPQICLTWRVRTIDRTFHRLNRRCIKSTNPRLRPFLPQEKWRDHIPAPSAQPTGAHDAAIVDRPRGRAARRSDRVPGPCPSPTYDDLKSNQANEIGLKIRRFVLADQPRWPRSRPWRRQFRPIVPAPPAGSARGWHRFGSGPLR